MARYIDADRMREDWLENGENEYVYDANAVLQSIDEQPTADVVEVVRCKNCRYGEIDDSDIPNQYFCHYDGGSWNDEDHYCSYGKKVE